MAARTAPARTAAQHQSLLHFVGVATLSDEKVLAKVREMVLPAIEKDGPIEAWIIDDTSFHKPEIALDQIRWACETGLPRGVALMDAAYAMNHGCGRE